MVFLAFDTRLNRRVVVKWLKENNPASISRLRCEAHLQGRLDLDRFVSETITLDDVEEAFHKMERGEVLRSVVVL